MRVDNLIWLFLIWEENFKYDNRDLQGTDNLSGEEFLTELYDLAEHEDKINYYKSKLR